MTDLPTSSPGNVPWQTYVDTLVNQLTARVDRQFMASEHAVEVALAQVNDALARTEQLQIERTESVRREVKTALEAATIAISKSDSAAEKRFTSFDELRQTLSKQATLFVSREVADSQFASIHAAIDGLDSLKANERLQVERVEALRRESAALQDSNKAAIAKSDSASEKRFESVNEFRAQLAAQAERFIPREVVDQQTIEFRQQIAALTARVDQSTGGSQASARMTTMAIGAVGLILTIVVFLANYVFGGTPG